LFAAENESNANHDDKHYFMVYWFAKSLGIECGIEMQVNILKVIINEIKRTKMARSSGMHFVDHSSCVENNVALRVSTGNILSLNAGILIIWN
jgi:hypothetical protein